MKRVLKRIGYGIAILLLLLNIVVVMHASKFTYFYDSNIIQPKIRPEQLSGWSKWQVMLTGIKAYKKPITDSLLLPHQSFTVRTTDGESLAVWYAAQPQAKGLVLLFHGHGGNRAGIIAEATALYELGYSVVLTDFRAHGASTGNVCTIGYRESEDVYTMYAWALQFKQPIVLYGISLGAAAITKAIHDHANMQPSKVILDMPFASLKDATKGRLRLMHLPEEPMATMLVFWGSVVRGFWAFDLQPKTYVASMRCPVLLQWGEQDNRVALHETNAIFANLTHATSKTLMVYRQSGHQSLLLKEPNVWMTSVSTFLKQ